MFLFDVSIRAKRGRSVQLIGAIVMHRENPQVIVNQEKIWTIKKLDAKEGPNEQ